MPRTEEDARSAVLEPVPDSLDSLLVATDDVAAEEIRAAAAEHRQEAERRARAEREAAERAQRLLEELTRARAPFGFD